MALAWLDLVGVDNGALRFAIDTGSSRYYQVRVGRSQAKREGLDWVDDVYLSTPVKLNDAGGQLLGSTREVTIPTSRLDQGDAYVQLVSFKSPDGRGPALSRVARVPAGAASLRQDMDNFTPPLSVSASMSIAQAFESPRHIPCVHSPDAYSREASLDELLAAIVKVASPAVLKMLGGSESGGAGSVGKNGGTGAGSDGSPASGVIALLLKTLLSGLQPGGAAAGVPTKAADIASKPQSLGGGRLHENRFSSARNMRWSHPFIFGIDDAILGTLIGPVLNVLPQLLNSANQARLQTRQADNKLVTDALNTVNQRMLMEKVLAAQAKTSESDAEIAQLKQLLLQAIEATADKPQAKSLSVDEAIANPAPIPSKRAVLAFVLADALQFNGKSSAVFLRDHDLELKARFTVGEPVPRNALARAIVTLTFKAGHDRSGWVTTTINLENVAPNGVLTLPISRADLARLPGNRRIAVIAELRWRGERGAVYSATGATDFVLVGKYFVRERGGLVGEERELTDMTRFRPFWNKIWEAPPIDALNKANSGSTKLLWELNANTRYMVLLSAHQQSNGVMETKLNAAAPDADDVALKVDGRLKAGVELSIDELNKLASLWEGQTPLDADHLAAMKSDAVARTNGGECISHLQLKGRARQRGMVWVVPVFQLAEFTMSTVQKTDDAGQVVAVGEETVRFPLPVAARVLGLKSTDAEPEEPSAPDAAQPEYSFAGYSIVVSKKIALTPTHCAQHRAFHHEG